LTPFSKINSKNEFFKSLLEAPAGVFIRHERCVGYLKMASGIPLLIFLVAELRKKSQNKAAIMAEAKGKK
jgi:hypothetical protein